MLGPSHPRHDGAVLPPLPCAEVPRCDAAPGASLDLGYVVGDYGGAFGASGGGGPGQARPASSVAMWSGVGA